MIADQSLATPLSTLRRRHCNEPRLNDLCISCCMNQTLLATLLCGFVSPPSLLNRTFGTTASLAAFPIYVVKAAIFFRVIHGDQSFGGKQGSR